VKLGVGMGFEVNLSPMLLGGRPLLSVWRRLLTLNSAAGNTSSGACLHSFLKITCEVLHS